MTPIGPIVTPAVEPTTSGGRRKQTVELGGRRAHPLVRKPLAAPAHKLRQTVAVDDSDAAEGDGEATITTVTFEETGGKTRVVVRDLYPSKESLEADSGSTYAMRESLAQLDDLLATLQAAD